MSMIMEPGNSMFIYKNPCCDCKVTTNYKDDGTEYHRLMVKTIGGCYKYAYMPVEGLVIVDKRGKVDEKKKVIEDFINMDLSKADGIKKFVDDYGFIMQLPDDGKYKTFDPQELQHLIERFRILVKLITAITDTPANYDAILKYTIFLLFVKPQRISTGSDEKGLSSCEHTFTKLWNNMDDLPDYKHDLIKDEINGPENDYYLIPDSFTGKNEIHYVESYNDECLILQDSKFIAAQIGEQYAEDYAKSMGSNLDLQLFRTKIVKLYRDAFGENISDSTRYAIDFFYHLIYTVADDIAIQENGIIYVKEKLENLPRFDNTFKKALARLARFTIKEEFDYALYNIHPTYNIDTMSPQWLIPDFWTALYFALFYINPKYEIFRVCANPNCGRLFKVEISNKRTIYHDPYCQNAAAQRRHRNRMKAKANIKQAQIDD